MSIHTDYMGKLAKVCSATGDEVSLALNRARNHNLSEAIDWIKSAKRDVIKAETLLLNMRKAEKKNSLKYYN